MSEYPVPHGVHTSVTYPELRLLQRYANEAGVVLEIGTHFGFTCIGMALAGAHVTSADPHYEGPANAPDTWEPFLRNCYRHGLEVAIIGSPAPDWWAPPSHPVINAERRTIQDSFIAQEGSALTLRWGLVFIDGDHVWPCPMRDSQIARAHLRAPGYLAFHDVTPNWPGVYRTTEELTRSGEIVKLEQVGTLAVYQVRDYQK